MRGDRIYLGSLYSSPELDEYEETRAALLQQEVELRKINISPQNKLYFLKVPVIVFLLQILSFVTFTLFT